MTSGNFGKRRSRFQGGQEVQGVAKLGGENGGALKRREKKGALKRLDRRGSERDFRAKKVGERSPNQLEKKIL